MFAFCVFLRAQFTWVHFSTFTEHFLRSKSYISNPISTLLLAAAAAAKSLQSCRTLCMWDSCDSIDGNPLGFPDPGILQARTLEWAASFLLQRMQEKVKVKSLSRGRLLATPWTAAYQAPLSMGFTRPEDWSGCHCLLRHCLLIVP